MWPDKYNPDGSRKSVPRVSLPFQVIETVNESRATREARSAPQRSLFDIYEGREGETFEDGWTNKLIWGNNLLVMSSLLERFAGKIGLIYIDPPFASGLDFSVTAPLGDLEDQAFKEQSLIEEKVYRDTWGRGRHSYLSMMTPVLGVIRELLTPNGTLYLHCDWHVGHYLKVVLDELFGDENFRNEIVWHYPHMSNVRKDFARKHDTIFRYSKGDTWTFNLDDVREPYDQQTLKRYETAVVFPGGYEAKANPLGKAPEDVWRIPPIRNVSSENQNFPTQKPEALVERIIKASSNPGDLVADFFVGSGTTIAVAETLGRRWIGCDIGRFAIHTTRKRLLAIEGCKPFELLNLGKYERQYWQVSTFGHGSHRAGELALYEYLAFMLRLYGASPVPGLTHLHGKKGRGMVHIGAVDAPVTIAEVNDALDECVAIKQSELHVLGWEWEMGLAGPNNDYTNGGLMHEAAKRKGVKLALLQIPREVMEDPAAATGSIQFFELAYVGVEIKSTKRNVTIHLKDFVIANTELIPKEVRDKVQKWSDYIDYWAVDWEFQNDTFMQGWVTYRTRNDRSLALVSEAHTYPNAGSYRILIKVIDIFGNDTSQACDVEIG